MKLLFQDTETTGLLDFKKDIMDNSQPRICQLACLLTDEEGNILDSMNHIIKPDRWNMSPEAQAVHGITVERAQAEGVPIKEVMAGYIAMKASCDLRVGHNLTYDKRMLLRETIICGFSHVPGEKDTYDTMHESKNIVKCPPTEKMMASGRKDFKAPKLEEAYEFFTGKKLEGTHDAWNDVHAVKDIYFGIQKHKQELVA